ncbi:hypothetical protein Fcan01_06002 [Folsomia candida]|uniref:EamA domain-containing protein n=2 Tax=Folsomia candida TaxID=158441 RepID=A0A226EP25_FOLCA|nr:hypothetical protein Fcan01_06002 [Folsomia candida]
MSKSNSPNHRYGESEENRHSSSGWSKRTRFFGIILTTLSALTFSLNALTLKLLNHLHPFNLGVWTFLLMTGFSALWTVRRKCKTNLETGNSIALLPSVDKNKTIALLWLRAFLGVCALTLFFYAMKFMDVADALLIDSTSPIFVHIFAYGFLQEKCAISQVFATVLAIAGIGFVARPPLLTGDTQYNADVLIGCVLAFGCMLCITLSLIVLKFLETVPQDVVTLVLGIWGTVQCLVLSLLLGVLQFPTHFEDICKIVGTAVLFFVGQTLLTVALKHEDAGPVGLLRTTEVLFAFVWQFVFLNVVPNIYSILGAVLIMSGVIITLVRKWMDTSGGGNTSIN